MEQAVKAKKPRRQRTELQRRSRAGYLFILPFIIGFIFFYVQPLIISLYYTFCDVKPQAGGGMSKEFIGLDNYVYYFTKEANFLPTLANTFKDMLITTPVILIFSLFIAVILNQKFRGRMLARAVFFMPVVVTSGIIISVIRGDMFSNEMKNTSGMSDTIFQATGMLEILSAMNLPESITNIFISIVNETFDTLWKCGVQILLFLASLQSVPPQLYEAAKIEGATSWEIFWKVTFPNVTPIILVNLVYTIIDSITDYSNELMRMIDSTAFTQMRYSHACTMSWVFFVLLFALVGLIMLFMRNKVFYQNN